MELAIKEASVAASRQKIGIDIVSVEDGQSLKIETSPDGEEILNVAKPAGVSWAEVQIQVIINEVDQ